jgi:ubiquinone/menaquinone biosynthesis C-methylase UbiE
MAFGYVPPKRTGSRIRDLNSHLRELRLRIEGFNNLLKRIQVKDIKNALRLKRNDRVLELGAGAVCGYACELSKQVTKYVATDIFDISHLHTYRQIPKSLELIRCDAHFLPFESKSFNKIFMSEIIPVLKHPAMAMKEAGRVLEDTGTIIMVNGGQYLHIADFYESSNLFIKWIKHQGIKRGYIPNTYEEYHAQLVKLHGTNYDYFIDREKYLEGLLSETGFQIEGKSYSVRYHANYFYQLLCFLRVCLSGTPILTRNYIYLLPLFKLLNGITKNGKGMALIIVAKKVPNV